MSQLMIFGLMAFCCVSCVKLTPSHEIEGKRFIASFEREMYQDCDLKPYIHGGQFFSSVNGFEFWFTSNRKLSLDEARRFYFLVVDRLIARINSDKDLIPHLGHYPFQQQDVDVSIAFLEGERHDLGVEPPYIANVGGDANMLYYSIRGEGDNLFKKIHSESVKRARGILEHQNNLLNTQPASP